jgi:phytoene synthase
LTENAAAPPSARETELATHYALCEAALREKDRDLWLAALYAPEPRRKHLHALGAFAREISEIPGKVTQPLLGEMRLRWWADAIETPAAEGGARAHPIADALLDTISTCGLEPKGFADFLDAHVVDFYDDPQPDSASLLAYCDETNAAWLRWSAKVLGASGDHAALREGGAAQGLVGVLRRLPFGSGKFLPEDLLARCGVSRQDVAARADTPALRAAVSELRRLALARFDAARSLARDADEATRIALLPLANLPLHLERIAARDYGPFRAYEEPSALSRQWRLWRAARRGI